MSLTFLLAARVYQGRLVLEAEPRLLFALKIN